MSILKQLVFVGLISSVSVGCVTTATEGDSSCVVPVVSEQPAKASRCEVERIDDNVLVHVVIDSKAESIKSRKILEGTAMIRTKICLRKEFEGLPKNFNLPSRRIKNSFDDDTGMYYYTTSFKLKDINKKIGR